MHLIDVIMPVYRGHEAVRQCISSVIRYPQQTRFEIIIIDDASPERGVSEFLDRVAADYEGVTLIRNAQNRGFVASVNIGMALHPKRDVVLLNSDTKVANNWLDRLNQCAYRSRDIGTVTPFSNDATICSFPGYCRYNELLFGWSLEDLDSVFAEANQGVSVEIPTAIGFCMYIKRACIEDIGLFDEEKFGHGYGEENDFCMRATARGWRHELCGDTFVFHSGATSFGDEKQERVANAMETLDKLYPRYHQRVHKHISRNPARALRANAMIHLIRESKKQTVLFVNHNMGGGTEKHIQELFAYHKEKMDVVVIRPGTNCRVIMTLGAEKGAESFCFALPFDYGEVIHICRFLRVSRVHFHHTMGVPSELLKISEDLGVPFDVTLHDYYFINANPTLIGVDGQFCYENKSGDDLCREAYPIPGNLTAEQWRKNQNDFLRSADRIISPSRYTAKLFKEYFKDIDPVFSYHPDWEKDAPYPPLKLTPLQFDEAMRILVLGALSREKGADLLEACARISKSRDYALEFHLIGYGYRPLDAAVVQNGAYHYEQLPQMISDLVPHLVWFPAQWPETYSYTLSEALRAGLPIAGPDFGAFPERLAGRPYTWIINWHYSAEQWLEFFLDSRKHLSAKERIGKTIEWEGQPEPGAQIFSYDRDYIIPTPRNRVEERIEVDIGWVEKFLTPTAIDKNGEAKMTRREHMLIHLLRIRENRLAFPVLRFLPYRFQRFVKRRFSSRAVHEVLLQNEREGGK